MHQEMTYVLRGGHNPSVWMACFDFPDHRNIPPITTASLKAGNYFDRVMEAVERSGGRCRHTVNLWDALYCVSNDIVPLTPGAEHIRLVERPDYSDPAKGYGANMPRPHYVLPEYRAYIAEETPVQTPARARRSDNWVFGYEFPDGREFPPLAPGADHGNYFLLVRELAARRDLHPAQVASVRDACFCRECGIDLFSEQEQHEALEKTPGIQSPRHSLRHLQAASPSRSKPTCGCRTPIWRFIPSGSAADQNCSTYERYWRPISRQFSLCSAPVKDRFYKWPTIALIDHAVPHQGHIIEIPRDILNYIDIVIRTVFLFMVEWLDGEAIPVLEERVEQRAVRIAARVPHNIDLIGRRADETEQLPVVVSHQVTDRFDILEVFVVIEVGNRFIILVEFIPVTEDYGIVIVIQFSVDVVYFEL